MALGFSKAGYDISAIYIDFSDVHNRNVCATNWGEVVQDISLIGNQNKGNPLFENIDCIAGKIHNQHFSVAGLGRHNIDRINPFLQIGSVIQEVRPMSILLQCFGVTIKDELCIEFCKELKSFGYGIRFEHIETGVITGFPVKEKATFIVGLLNETNVNLEYLRNIEVRNYSVIDFIEKEELHDQWYYKISPKHIEAIEKIEDSCIYCWDNKQYKKEYSFKWNYRWIPLICQNYKMRKITHKEIARLKGIPDEYMLEINNKSILYKKLMYCSNVQLIRELASIICTGDNENIYQKREITKALQFEKIFISFLNKKDAGKVSTLESVNTYVDLQYRMQDIVYNFEIKIYRNNLDIENKIVTVCRNLSVKRNDNDDVCILVVANIVEAEIKGLVKAKYNIIVWDIENLLWYLEEFPQLRSDFISLLSFNISTVIPKKPEYDIFERIVRNDSKIDLQERLRKIKPGKEEASIYEDVCVDIVKFLFSEHMEFFEAQKKSNSDLYRFDFCGKIKYGCESEFFETIQRFFNTKYVIFEFKNYTEEITQKEIYTTEKYLYEKALRKVAIIISRKGCDENAKKAARGSLRELGKLIVCLSDEDINKLIDMKNSNINPTNYLEILLDDMLLDLEK